MIDQNRNAVLVRPAVDPLSMNLSDLSYPVDQVELSEVEKARREKKGGGDMDFENRREKEAIFLL